MILLYLILFTALMTATSQNINDKISFHIFSKNEKVQYHDNPIQYLYFMNILNYNIYKL